MIESLSRVEREVYELIAGAGMLMAKDIPFKKAGAVPSLVKKGLIQVIKKRIHSSSDKTCKFLCIDEE
jgi:hypothetical protein